MMICWPEMVSTTNFTIHKFDTFNANGLFNDSMEFFSELFARF